MIDPDLLTAHTGFIRGLARSLIQDEATADDVTQKTLLQALERPPRSDATVRGWLYRVTVNFARKEVRGESRRRTREERRSPALPPGPAERVEKEEVIRAVTESVLRLEEPYRSTIILKFYENKSAREIAEEEGVPEATVRSRLRRALIQLREGLDEKTDGDRSQWTRALLPLAAPRSEDVSSGAFDAGKFTYGGQDMAWVADEEGILVADGLPEGQAVVRLDRMRSVAFVPIAAGEVAETTIALPRGVTVEGQVVDGEGRAVEDAEVFFATGYRYWDSGLPLARSGPDGSFEIRDLSRSGYFGAVAPGYAPSLMTYVKGKDTVGNVSIALTLEGTDCRIAGQVQGPDGRGLAGAKVVVELPGKPKAYRLEGTHVMEPAPRRVTTDSAGRFRIEGLRPARFHLLVEAEGCAPHYSRVELEPGEEWNPEIRLLEPVIVSGTVRGLTGKPAAGIEVLVRDSACWEFRPELTTRTEKDGSYRIEGLAPGRLSLAAKAPDARGRASASRSAAAGEHVQWNAELTSGLSIEGRLLDDGDLPLEGWTVVSWAPYGVTKNADDPTGVRAWLVRAQSVDSKIREMVGRLQRRLARTDSEGRFVLENCFPFEHRLEVYGPGQQGGRPRVELSGVRPESGEVSLRVDREAQAASSVSGRLLDWTGAPLRGANVVVRPVEDLYASVFVVSGDEGRFEATELSSGAYRVFADLDPCGLPEAVKWLPSRPIALETGEDLDLGTIRLARPGSAVVHLGGSIEGSIEDLEVELWDPAGGFRIPCFVDGEGGATAPTTLLPGEYLCLVWSSGSARAAASGTHFTVSSGEETRLTLPLVAGVPCTIAFDQTTPPSWTRTNRVEIRDAAGSLVYRSDINRDAHSLPLAPGSYLAVGQMDSGSRGEARFEVPEGSGEVVKVLVNQYLTR